MAKIPFSIDYKPQIESGEYKVVTGDDRPVKIICWDKKIYGGRFEIVGLVPTPQGDTETVQLYCPDGTLIASSWNEKFKLFIITPEPELSEFEKKLSDIVGYAISLSIAEPQKQTSEFVKEYATKLLELAREEFVKHGYVIEKKAFHDAVEKVDPDVMKEVSETTDLSNFFAEIGKKYPEVPFGRVIQIGLAAYNKSKEEALKDLPRWRKCADCTPKPKWSNEWIFSIDSENVTRESAIVHKGYFLPLDGLEKLPGFKED